MRKKIILINALTTFFSLIILLITSGFLIYIRNLNNYENAAKNYLSLTCSIFNGTNVVQTYEAVKDTESNNIYAKCIVCGNPPENIFIDADGNQVSYESKILNDIKDMVYRVEQRISNLEREAESLGSGQVLIEQSIAYINQFLSENK